MTHFRFFILFLLVLTALAGRAVAQDYLSDDREPADEVSRLATPFVPQEKLKPQGYLGRFSDEPFLHDAEFSLRPRMYYRSVRNNRGVQDTFAAGGSVSLTTGWWRDFLQIGVTGYTTQPLVAVKTDNRSGLVDSDGEGFFTLGQAWMKLKAGTASATLFRQTLNMPFININDARMIPNTFEAYHAEATFWEFLQVNAGYVAQMKARDTPDFVPMSEIAGAPQVDRGTAFAGFVLGSQEQTYFGVLGEMTPDLFCSTYLQAGHTWKVTPDFQIRGDVQFADQRSTGAEYIGAFETQLYGGRLAASYGGAVASFTYTNTAEGSDLLNPYGADPAFNMLMISDFALAGEQSFGGSLSYNFAKIGLPGVTAFGSFVYGTLPEDNWDQELNATVDWRIGKGPLNNLWLRLRYAHNESSWRAPIEDFRVILNYTFTF